MSGGSDQNQQAQTPHCPAIDFQSRSQSPILPCTVGASVAKLQVVCLLDDLTCSIYTCRAIKNNWMRTQNRKNSFI
jgi:hypothetical protein